MWGDGKVLVLESGLGWLAQGKGAHTLVSKGGQPGAPHSRPAAAFGLVPAVLYC